MRNYQAFPNIVGDDSEDTAKLRELAGVAREYIQSFHWCPPIDSMYLGFGVGGIAAVFLFKFAQKISEIDDSLWVVVGDLPSAYLVVEEDDDPAQALERYCDIMDDWVSAVRGSGDLADVYPIPVEATVEHADMLCSRIGFLRTELVPLAKS
jgi:hypothetical protein